jgi:hypothetical protein
MEVVDFRNFIFYVLLMNTLACNLTKVNSRKAKFHKVKELSWEDHKYKDIDGRPEIPFVGAILRPCWRLPSDVRGKRKVYQKIFLVTLILTCSEKGLSYGFGKGVCVKNWEKHVGSRMFFWEIWRWLKGIYIIAFKVITPIRGSTM